MGTLSFTDLEIESVQLQVVTKSGQQWTVEVLSTEDARATLRAVANREGGTVELTASGHVRRAEVGPVGAPLLPLLAPAAQPERVIVHEVTEHGVGRELIDSTECICGFWGDDAEWHEHFTELGMVPPCAGAQGCEVCFPEDGDDD